MKLCRYAAVFALMLALIFPASALAAKARKAVPAPAAVSGYQNKPIVAGSTVWYCAYGGNAEILCRLGERGSESKPRPYQVIDPRLPRVVDDIHNHPQRLAQGHVSIPLHTIPCDFELVGELAEAVMCGSNASCGVIFAENFAGLQALVTNFEQMRQGFEPARLAEAVALADGDS